VKKGGKCQNSISTKTRIETPYLL